MANELLVDMKRYVGFGEAEARAVKGLKSAFKPHFPMLVQRFYDVILKHPNAKAVFGGDVQLIERLKLRLAEWLDELFCGEYDDAYFEARCRIGRTHVEIDLPQHYMFTGMSVMRSNMLKIADELSPRPSNESILALQTLLELDLAIMNLTYREDLVKRIAEAQRAEYEARISESEHMATIGQLAASLAHEIKNPLAGISGAIQVLGKALSPNHPHKEIIAEALRQIDRLDAAVKDLLIYARPKPPETASHDVSELIEHALLILREEPAFRNVSVHFDGTGRGHRLKIDAAQIQQVITNLFINAAHACDRGGDVYCRVSRYNGGTQVIIQDTGAGMSPHVLAKAFEPFYTTKARGTGLGLSICKRIVESHGGHLKIESTLGKGTRVTIELPEKL